MKKIAEKVALAAQICITLVFVLTLILCMTGTIQTADLQDNKVVIVLFIVLILVYASISAYLLYVAFAEKENVKRILLFYDNDCATRANAKVVDNIVKGCANEVPDVKVRRTKLRVDDKQGLIATLYVEISADNISTSLEKLRLLLVDSFKNTLGITFSTINFEIDKLNKKFVPNKERAEQNAEVTEEKTETENDVLADNETALPEIFNDGKENETATSDETENKDEI